MAFSTSLALLAFFLLLAAFIWFQAWKESKNPVWLTLLERYKAKSFPDRAYRIGIFFFRQTGEDVFQYYNSMKIYADESGYYFGPTINHFCLSPLYIPASDLESSGEQLMFLRRRSIYLIKDEGLEIAF